MILVFFSLLWFNPALRQPQRGPSRSSPQPHQQPESPPLHRSAFSWFYILWPVTCPSGLDNLPRDILSDPLPVPGLQPFLSPHQKSLESCWILGTQAQAHVGQALLPRGQLKEKQVTSHRASGPGTALEPPGNAGGPALAEHVSCWDFQGLPSTTEEIERPSLLNR